ncbi:MAG: FHA domain-containing protein [Cyanobacteria bacterium P01_H01_bin.121]
MTTHNYILIVEEEGHVQTYELSQPYYTIGRASSSNIRLNAARVSRLHGALVRIHDGSGHTTYRLVDGNHKTGQPSQNGITVNGAKIAFKDLQDGDQITFGRSVNAEFINPNSSTLSPGPSVGQMVPVPMESQAGQLEPQRARAPRKTEEHPTYW